MIERPGLTPRAFVVWGITDRNLSCGKGFATTIPLATTNPPLSLLTPRTSFSLASVACALGLAFGGALAPSSDARAAAKAAAPTLTIEAKNCSIGPTEDDRSATVTALALLGSTGERVTMRFTVQSRQGKTRWKSLLFKDPSTTKKWETTEAAGAGLKLTKTIPKLPEGYDYRVVVESRAVDAGGKVVTKTARKYVPCKQPLFTPTLTLGKVQILKNAPAGYEFLPPEGPYLSVPIKNLGRLPSGEVVLTIAKADTRELIAQVGTDSLKGGGNTRWVNVLPPGCSQLYITVQEKGAPAEALTVDQATTVNCTAQPATTARRATR